MTNWNIVKMDEGFIRPQKMVGAVIMNGAVHTNLCTRAKNEKTPYYPQATGIYGNNQAKIAHADIIFTLARSTITHNSNSSNNAIRLLGVSKLNGHGKSGKDGNEILMQNINVLGIAEVPQTPNNQGFFNLIRGGIMTIQNNSKWSIQVGDYLEAYAPTMEELRDGGQGKDGDSYGEAQLWFKPYCPELNSLTPKPIYNCLTAENNSGHTAMYRKTCEKLEKSVKDMSLIVMSSLFKKIKKEFSGDGPVSEVAFLNKMSKALDEKEVTENLREKLFVSYSGKEHLLEREKLANSDLNKKQVRAMSQFLTSSALLHHHVHKNVLWQAMSSADPKRNLSVQFLRYAK